MAGGRQLGGNSKTTSRRYENRVTKDGVICNKCDEVKTSEEYGVNKSWCSDCLNEYQRKKRKKQYYKLW
jgi:uncharacterized CHY-type Zn-finger protein